MGLIKTAIGGALGANQPTNGLNNSPFASLTRHTASRGAPSESGDPHTLGNTVQHRHSDSAATYRSSATNNNGSYRTAYANHVDLNDTYPAEDYEDTLYEDRRDSPEAGRRQEELYGRNSSWRGSQQFPMPPPYHQSGYDQPQIYESGTGQRYTSSLRATQNSDKSSFERPSYDQAPPLPPRRSHVPSDRLANGFRPLALPQIAYGDGQPFLRGYSSELLQFGIGRDAFLRFVDDLNVAIIPNPENVIFQKAANIAGYFVPGAASIALIGGQFAVGIGAAVGKLTQTSKVLCRANLEMFIPAGLEVCTFVEGALIEAIKAEGLDVPSSAANGANDTSMFGASSDDRLARYGESVAYLDEVRPPLENIGRRDPIALIGGHFSNQKNQKQLQKAQKDIGKGKTKKGGSLDASLKWLIVRRAPPDAMARWQEKMAQTEKQAQEEAVSERRV